MTIMSLRDDRFLSKQSPHSQGDCFATCARSDMQTMSLRRLQSQTQEEFDALLPSMLRPSGGAFQEFIQKNRDTIPMLVTVLRRPRESTRRQLRELALELEHAGFNETTTTIAWRDMTNQEITAHIVGFIRHIATGDLLVPYEERIEWTYQQVLSARSWTKPE